MQAGLAWGAVAQFRLKEECTSGCGTGGHPENQCNRDTDCTHSDPCLVGDCHNGHCHHIPLCADGFACTVDTCDNGVCTYTPYDSLCDDNDACTNDQCVGSNGVGCVFTNNTASCDDLDDCTDFDTCAGGVCAGTDVVCNVDGDPCTVDFCDAQGACVVGPQLCEGTSLVCDDSDPSNPRCVECTIDDPCPPNLTCDLGPGVCVECTADSQCPQPTVICDTSTNICVECLDVGDCPDDGDPCTGVQCWSDNTCRTGPIFGCCTIDTECDDQSTCTSDTCCTNPAGCCSVPGVPADPAVDTCVLVNECLFNPNPDGDDLYTCDDPNDGCPFEAGACPGEPPGCPCP